MQANKSAMKAMIINRVGDFGLYFSLFLLYYYFNSLDFSVIASYCVNNNYTLSFFVLHKSIIISNIDIICLFLLLGVVGKSAQIGLHMWLPDAMEGPTPVSALIHAATMVTAGVFLLIRSSFLFEKSSLILFLVTFLGLITVLLSGIIGIFQNDIKKIIAYSTCSQLGYMILSCGLSNYSLALYHLFNHGFFKALLFLCSGSIIHALFDEQDMRKMGNLYRQLPLTFVTFITAILALLGLPFFTGFYSKDFIIETTAINYTIIPNRFFFWLNIFTLILTCLYSIKVLYMVFFGEIKLYNRLKVHENSYWISGVLIFLTLVSLIVGFLTQEFFLGFGNNY
jgi:NADH-ubiquinone oxidoreductase chain 5